MPNYMCRSDKAPLGQRPYALAAVEALLERDEVYEDDLRKLVVRAVHGRLPTRKTEKKKDAVRFWRTMKNLQDNGIVDGAHYGLAPGREKTYMLSKRAKAYMARSAAKTRPQYAAVLGL